MALKLVEGFCVLLRGGTVVEDLESNFNVTRSRPYGHMAASLGTLHKVGFDQI